MTDDFDGYPEEADDGVVGTGPHSRDGNRPPDYERPCGCRTEEGVFIPCADHVVWA